MSLLTPLNSYTIFHISILPRILIYAYMELVVLVYHHLMAYTATYYVYSVYKLFIREIVRHSILLPLLRYCKWNAQETCQRNFIRCRRESVLWRLSFYSRTTESFGGWGRGWLIAWRVTVDNDKCIRTHGCLWTNYTL